MAPAPLPLTGEGFDMATILLKASAFIAWILTRVGLGYVYGSIGQTCTIALLKTKERQYGKKMGANYYQRNGDYTKGLCARWLGKWVSDCSGLVKAARKALTGVWSDKSAQGFYASCELRGLIKDMPLFPGCSVYMYSKSEDRMCHIGIYIGGRKVIENRGVKYGVVVTDLYARPWSHWGLLPWLNYDQQQEGTYQHPGTPSDGDDGGDGSNPKPDDDVDPKKLPYLNYGDEGQYVAFMQSLLVKKGYAMPKSVKKTGKYGMDGIWRHGLGRIFCETDKVFRRFQKEHGLEMDGVCGPLSWAELLK